MSVRDYRKEVLLENKEKNKKHLELLCEGLSEEEFVKKLTYLFKELADYEIDNVKICFSCDYWSGGFEVEEDF